MAVFSIQHSLQGNSGLAEDRFVNTIHVLSLPDPLTINFAACAEAVRQFYRPTTGQGPANYMSNAANAAGRSIKIYDLSDPKPRTPVWEITEGTAPWTDSGLQNLPSEVAVCLSYKGDEESGQNPARRRGRIYIGPLTVNAMTTATGEPARVLPAFAQELSLAAQRLHDGLEIANAVWVVYSPTNDPNEDGSVDSATIVTSVWIDNAFDIQRRRGETATLRTANAVG